MYKYVYMCVCVCVCVFIPFEELRKKTGYTITRLSAKGNAASEKRFAINEHFQRLALCK